MMCMPPAETLCPECRSEVDMGILQAGRPSPDDELVIFSRFGTRHVYVSQFILLEIGYLIRV